MERAPVAVDVTPAGRSAGAKTGFATGYDPALSVRDMAAFARDAEGRGYDMVFFSEALIGNRDSVSALTAFGLATSEILLGCTQIVRFRTPFVMAQTLASLDELTNGRMVLAAGACTDRHARRHGLMPLATPAVTLRESVEALRLLLRGETADYHGRSLDFEASGLNWVPKRADIPIWIAAISRTGLRIAGRLADGVLLDAHTSPEYAENAIKILKGAVGEAGRDWSAFEVAQIIPCSVEDDHDNAVNAVRWEAATRFRHAEFPVECERRMRVGEPALDPEDFPRLLEALRARGHAGVAAALPAAFIEQTTACGTPDEVVQRVARYRRAGVTFPLLRPQARHQVGRVLDLFAKK